MQHETPWLRAALIGAASGVIASLVSETFQTVWNAAQVRMTGEPMEGGDDQEDTAPVKTADEVSEATLGRRVPEGRRQLAGRAVHYVTGAGLGGLYGVLVMRYPSVAAGRGAAYGAVTTVLLNDGIVPALGLAPPPTETPLGKHVYALATHLVFGLALEGSRRELTRLSS